MVPVICLLAVKLVEALLALVIELLISLAEIFVASSIVVSSNSLLSIVTSIMLALLRLAFSRLLSLLLEHLACFHTHVVCKVLLFDISELRSVFLRMHRSSIASWDLFLLCRVEFNDDCSSFAEMLRVEMSLSLVSSTTSW